MTDEPTGVAPGAGLADEPTSGWRATRTLGVTAVCLLAGLLFGASASLARESGSVGESTTLAQLIRERDSQVRDLSREADGLRGDVAALESSRSSSVAIQDSRRAEQLAPGVGLAPVEGPALSVTLDDAGYSLDEIPKGYTVDDVVVHQQDLQAVVNALWAGGAEAMMVQDQRIVATSSVQCVGNTLYLQGRVYSPPFTITAVGNVQGMVAALDRDPVVATYRQWVDLVGLGYDVKRLGTVTLPAFGGTTAPRHATAVPPARVDD